MLSLNQSPAFHILGDTACHSLSSKDMSHVRPKATDGGFQGPSPRASVWLFYHFVDRMPPALWAPGLQEGFGASSGAGESETVPAQGTARCHPAEEGLGAGMRKGSGSRGRSSSEQRPPRLSFLSGLLPSR